MIQHATALNTSATARRPGTGGDRSDDIAPLARTVANASNNMIAGPISVVNREFGVNQPPQMAMTKPTAAIP